MNVKSGVMAIMMVWSAISINAAQPKGASVNHPSEAKVPAQPAVKPIDTVKAAAATLKSDSLGRDALAKKFGTLRIISTPDSAVVIVDSSEKGQTPLSVDSLAAGQHVVLLKKKGYFVKKITAMVNPDTAQEVNVSLVKPGCLAVQSNPRGARLYIDDKETGITPWESAKLKPGDYTLRLEYLQRSSMEKRVGVKEGVCDTVMFSMQYSQAYLDSVSREQQRQDAQRHKFKKTANLAVLGAFLIFAITIIFIEASNGK
jgi:hypothetical protein